MITWGMRRAVLLYSVQVPAVNAGCWMLERRNSRGGRPEEGAGDDGWMDGPFGSHNQVTVKALIQAPESGGGSGGQGEEGDGSVGWWMPEKSQNCLGKLPPFVQLYVIEADHEGMLTSDLQILRALGHVCPGTNLIGRHI